MCIRDSSNEIKSRFCFPELKSVIVDFFFTSLQKQPGTNDHRSTVFDSKLPYMFEGLRIIKFILFSLQNSLSSFSASNFDLP